MTERTATLILHPYEAQCGNCGQNADPADTHHTQVPEGRTTRTDHRSGCGALFAEITYQRIGYRDELEAVCRRVRPDLPIGKLAGVMPGVRPPQ
ncbi:hypothetical protein ACFCXC_14870 [Streptomyces microflavus]|uniref:hypothetical protein n=1 Tax=Streptomyces microflavus TaxID=1919 RepID=UPI0035E2A954